MLQAVYINENEEIVSEDSIGVFTNLDYERYSTSTDCGGVSIKTLTSLGYFPFSIKINQWKWITCE